MTNLNSLQSQFSSCIKKENFNFLADQIVPARGLTSEDSIQVYASGYSARLTDALGETFESVWRVLGDEEFYDLSKNFIKEYDSKSFTLSDYGAQFSHYLKSTYADHLFLSELADFEWNFKELFHKKQELGLGSLDLQAIENLAERKVEFVSSLFLRGYNSPVYEIWKLRQSDESEIPELDRMECLLVYKREEAVIIKQLSDGIFWLFQSLRSGKSIEAALGNLPESLAIEEKEIGEFFQFLAGSNLIQSIV